MMHRGLFEVTATNCLETFKTFLADFYPEGKLYSLGDGLVCVADRNRWFRQSTTVTIIAKPASAAPENNIQVVLFGGDRRDILDMAPKNKMDITDTFEHMQTQLFRFAMTFSELTIRED